MKIHKIILENLNSLIGHWEIDFEKSPFNQSQLFAITGPTGAGKTTLLDVLTLALFGKTNRLGIPGEKIIGLSANFAKAEVHFSINNTTYQSSWWGQRGKSSPRPPKMQLARVIPFEILEEKVSKVPQKVEEITGLDFNRFIRSVYLTQGGFQAFLFAKEKDKASLLEKITDTEIYAKISMSTYQRCKEEQNKLEEIQNLRDHYKVTEERVSSQDLEEIKNKAEKKNRELDKLLEQENYQKQKKELNSQLEKITIHLKSFENKKNEFQKREHILEKVERARKILPFIIELEHIQKEIHQWKSNIEKNLNNLKHCEEKFHILENKEKHLISNLKNLRNQNEQNQNVREIVLLLDQKIQSLKDRLLQKDQEGKHLFKHFQKTQNSLISTKKELIKQKDFLNQLPVLQKVGELLPLLQTHKKIWERISKCVDSNQVNPYENFVCDLKILIKNPTDFLTQNFIENYHPQKMLKSILEGKSTPFIKKEKEEFCEKINSLLKPYNWSWNGEDFPILLSNVIQIQNKDLKIEQDKEGCEEKTQKLLKIFSELQGQLTTLEDQKYTFTKEKEKIEREISSLKKQREDLYGLKNPKDEAHNFQDNLLKTEHALKDITHQLGQLRAKREFYKKEGQKSSSQKDKLISRFESQNKKVSDALINHSFKHIKDVRIDILDDQSEEKLRNDLKIFTDRYSQLQGQKEQLQAHLENFPTQKITTEQISEDFIKNKKRESSELMQKYGRMKEIFLQQNQKEKKFKQQNIIWENQKTCTQHWEQMKNLIGSANGDSFRKFAQELTLDHLVIKANSYLKKLHPRYGIHKSKGLQLFVIDYNHLSKMRSVETLSGGESFLISLALGLGLSDLSGKKGAIESFFIDEGFGQLDDDHLDLVLTTLENLSSLGKRVGIISHLKGVKERLPTQIQVRPLGPGKSFLEITSIHQ